MEKTDNKPKFSEKNADEASNLLREIVVLVKKYERVYELLTPQERSAVGGIVFNVISIWGNFSLVGTLATKPIASSLIGQLMEVFNRLPVEPEPKPNPLFNGSIDKDIGN